MRHISGIQIFLIYDKKLLLILRDNKPDIKEDPLNGIHFPNTWALCGGGVEEGENFLEAAKRELKEELDIKLKLKILGVSPKGNCYFFSKITRKKIPLIRLNEGQDYNFFSVDEINNLILGGAIKTYWEKYKQEISEMILKEKPIDGKRIGLAIWEGKK